MQYYTINGASGGSFTTPRGTKVTIPAHAFVTQGNLPVTGEVTIAFKDIHNKSDMLLSRVTTLDNQNRILCSGGEFYIKAMANNEALQIAPGKQVNLSQPVDMTTYIDTSLAPMFPYIGKKNSSGVMVWEQNNDIGDVKFVDTGGYLLAGTFYFSLLQFSAPLDSGSWVNIDNATFFNNYTTTTLTLKNYLGTNNTVFMSFLVFKSINSIIILSPGTDGALSYPYAPIGLQCNFVILEVKNHKLFSSIVPITISSNQTIFYTTTITTSKEFKQAIHSL